MIKICFVCLGNICRSPMAEFMMKNKTNDYLITSKAVSNEEEGNDMHYGAKKELTLNNIPFSKRKATKLTKEDYDKYDYFICMDSSNIYQALNIFGNDKDKKIYRLLDFTNDKRDISDPWYTHNFKQTYDDIDKGLDRLIKYLKNKK